MIDRVISRRGLYGIDGSPLQSNVIKPAHLGSQTDFDIVRLAVTDMIHCITHISLGKISWVSDIKNKTWFTDIRDESKRYADDIMRDWTVFGLPTMESLHDIILYNAGRIIDKAAKLRATKLSNDDFISTMQYGTCPKIVFPPKRPRRYIFGEGHGHTRDAVKHPTVKHPTVKHPTVKHPTVKHKTSTIDKMNAIRRVIHNEGDYTSFVSENCGRHSVLLCVPYPRISSLYRKFDALADRYQSPIDCLITDKHGLDDLLDDKGGNDAKRIIHNGLQICGEKINVKDTVMPQRLPAVSFDDMAYNLDIYGFKMIFQERMNTSCERMRPEYVVTCTQFLSESRWYLSGMAVLLAYCNINWYLMLYLARTYGFAGTLYGILVELEKHVSGFEWPIMTLADSGVSIVETEPDTVSDALRTYWGL